MNKVLKYRLATTVFNRLSTDSMIIFMTIYISHKFNSFYTGIIIFSILFSGMIVNMYGGISLHNHKLKNIVYYGWIFHTLSILSMYLFFENDYILILCYFIKSLLFGYITPASEKIIIANTNKEDRKYILQINNILATAASSLGIIIGLFSFNYNPSHMVFFSGVMSLLTSVVYFFISNDKYFNENIPYEKKVGFNEYRFVFKNKQAFLIICSATLLFSIEFSYSQYLPIYIANEMPIGTVDLYAYSKVAISILSVFASLIFLKKIRDINQPTARIIMLSSMLAFVILYCFGALFLDYSNVFFIFIIISLCMGSFYQSIRYSEYTETIDERHSGLYLSLYSLTGRFGNIISSLFVVASFYLGHVINILCLFIIGIISILLMLIANRAD